MKGLSIARLVLYAFVFLFTVPAAILAGLVIASTKTDCQSESGPGSNPDFDCVLIFSIAIVGVVDTPAVVLLIAAIVVIITLAPLSVLE